MTSRARVPLVVFLSLTLLAPRSFAGEADGERPRLVVLMVFDQLRGDYPERWHEQFKEGGFKRLAKEGLWFKNCHYPYAYTYTAAGHASLVTGCSPNKHGIVANGWYDREKKEVIASVDAEKYRQLPMPAELPKSVRSLGVSPEQRLQKGVGDMLHEATKGKGKVVSLSIKPRSASLMGALIGHIVYWFSELTGGFVTSNFYVDEPHDWVTRFNDERLPDRYFAKDWKRLRDDLDYDKLAGKDDQPGEESKTRDLGRRFPHFITGGLEKPGPKFYDALTYTPMGNDLLFELAKRAIDAEKLGQDDTPDLLCVSFSCNDLAGHLYGPDSHEVLDITLRTDLLIDAFLNHLDKKVGKGKYALVLSSDHGICPLPEVAGLRGKEAGRVDPAKLKKQAEDHLQKTLGACERDYIEEFVHPWFYLDRKALALMKLDQSDVEQQLAAWLINEPSAATQAAFTRTHLLKGMPKHKLGEMVWRSYHAERCGDVIMVTRPYYFVSQYETGTTHGTPHEYDTHVPLFVFGPGVRAGASEERVTPQAAAAILAHFLGVEVPPAAEAAVPKGVRK